MVHLYILKLSNGQLYIGFSKDLRKRLKEHADGKVFTTKKYLPIKLAYNEGYASWKDAKEREKMLKRFGSTYVHLKKRLKHSLLELQERG
jgi:putative endonuclease